MKAQSYIICTAPRSGSTLLCALLRETGLAGHPDSHFHTPSLRNWVKTFDLQDTLFDSEQDARRAVFRAARIRGTGESKVCGLRLQQHSVDYFADQLALLHPTQPDLTTRIEAAFGRTIYIHLTRESKLDQAISFIRAGQSGLWHKAKDGTEIERLSDPTTPHYDADAITAQIAEFDQMETAWDTWFAAANITPLRLTYAEISAAPYGTLARVLHALGLPAETVTETPPPLAKLADTLSQEWSERYRAERAD